MDPTNNSLIVYTAQSKAVTDIIQREGAAFSKERYVRQKYQESAAVFTTAYGWFVKQMERFVPKPPQAEYPYWAFGDPASVDSCGEVTFLKMAVPLDEAVWFDMYDWIKIMRLQLIGRDEAEEARFRQKVADYGIRHESDIMLNNFYPELKREIEDSWQRLFRHHENVKAGDLSGIGSLQAGVWQLKQDWLID